MPNTATVAAFPTLADDIMTVSDLATASVVCIDPDTAKRWLTRNGPNRNLRQAQIVKYAHDMKARRWHLTGQPIQFAADGCLLDGQHRLHAIIKAGVSVSMFVVRGLAPDTQDYIDTGAKRGLGDQLTIAGYKNAAIVAAGARLALQWSTGRLSRTASNTVSDPEIREFMEENTYLTCAAKLAARVRQHGLDINPSVICAATWGLVGAGHTEQRAEEFFLAMAQMRTNGPGDPKHTLLQRIASARRDRNPIRGPHMLSLVIRTFNADYTGTMIRRLPIFARNEVIDVPAVVKPAQAT